jgi:hypothetical protein
MTKVPEQASQDTAGIAVVFDHQNLQGHKSGKISRGYDYLACYHNRNGRGGWLFRRRENFIPVSARVGESWDLAPLALTQTDEKERAQENEEDIGNPDQ